MDAQQNKNIEFYSRIKSKPISWLWYPYIPYGKITIIQGDPGEGKTSLALYIAMLLSKGKEFPLSDSPIPKQNVIYQNREDGASDTIKPRLERYGADCDRICFIIESDTLKTRFSPTHTSCTYKIAVSSKKDEIYSISSFLFVKK